MNKILLLNFCKSGIVTSLYCLYLCDILNHDSYNLSLDFKSKDFYIPKLAPPLYKSWYGSTTPIITTSQLFEKVQNGQLFFLQSHLFPIHVMVDHNCCLINPLGECFHQVFPRETTLC